MKKSIMIMFSILMTSVTAYGFTICTQSNSYIGVFPHNVDGTSKEINNTKKIWRVVFPAQTLTGFASCNDISGTANTPKTNLVTGATDIGVHCWCEMWPVTDYGYEVGPTSYWMYLKSYVDATTCASSCTTDCADAVKDDDTFRTAMFESMW
jgi:hypothetical protein